MSKLLNFRTINSLLNTKHKCLFGNISGRFEKSLNTQNLVLRCLHLERRRPMLKLCPRTAAISCRHLSLTIPALSSEITEAIPIPDDKVAEGVATVLADPALQDLGMSFLPLNMAKLFTLLHTNFDLSWCGTIVVLTLFFRLLLFPVVIMNQKNTIHLSKHMPQIQMRQLEMAQARAAKDYVKAQACAHELAQYVKENKINPLKPILPILAQAPVFLSFFWSLKSMANYPVESFKTGGALWFTDLTIPDPYLILPVMTCATLFVCLEVGADGIKTSQYPQIQKYIRVVPLIMLPITASFPAAILCYWCTNNIFTLSQIYLLKQEPVRKYFNIPKPEPAPQVKHNFFASGGKSFMEEFNETLHNMRIASQLEERKQWEKIKQMKNKDASS